MTRFALAAAGRACALGAAWLSTLALGAVAPAADQPGLPEGHAEYVRSHSGPAVCGLGCCPRSS